MDRWMSKIFILSSASLNFPSAAQKNTHKTEGTITDERVIFKWGKLFKTTSAAHDWVSGCSCVSSSRVLFHSFIHFPSKKSTTCSLNFPSASTLWSSLHK